jgi:hypothetical protein
MDQQQMPTFVSWLPFLQVGERNKKPGVVLKLSRQSLLPLKEKW